jgi:predicted RNA-binding Zn ribbon-like protein
MSSRISRLGGHDALDFANTVSWRDTPRAIDHLSNYAQLVAWCKAAGTLTRPAAKIATKLGTSSPGDAALILAHAHRLRAATLDIGHAVANGVDPTKDARSALLREVRASLADAELSANDGALSISYPPKNVRAALLGPIAWSALELFSAEHGGRLKQCPPSDCQWLFIDTTKNKSRRWCDMATCGNRAKVHRHRGVSM